MALAGALAVLAAGPVMTDTRAVAQTAGEWRTIAPENLLVLDTNRGRILIEMVPQAAPAHVERVRILSASGFYDGLTFHRVVNDFMAQGGDPQGDGMGASDLPNLSGEFRFRRGADLPFAEVTGMRVSQTTPVTFGMAGVLPVATQPDAQMMITRDGRVDAMTWFCPGVAAMARGGDPNSANSQFFLMRQTQTLLNGDYTAWGRVVVGLDVVRALKHGPDAMDGAVRDNPDVMTRVRVASDLPEGERPRVEVLDVRAPAFEALVERTRTERGVRFSICDIELPARVS